MSEGRQRHTAVTIVDVGTAGGDLTLDLASGLVDGLGDRVTVTILTSSASSTLERFRRLNSVSVVAIPGRSRRDLVCIPRRLRVAAAAAEPDIVIDVGLSALSLATSRRYRPARHVRIVHDASPHPALRDRFLHRLNVLAWNRSDALVTLSDYSARQLQGQTTTPILISRHGERHRFPPSTPSSIARRRKNLLFWGRFETYKGLGDLAIAFRSAFDRDPELRLKVVGRGSMSTDVRHSLEESGAEIDNRWIGDGELEELLAWTGTMVLPYRSATQSGPAATALSNGIPVVATDVGALREQVRHGVTGLIVPPGDTKALADALCEITSSYEFSERLSAGSFAVLDSEERWSLLGPTIVENSWLNTQGCVADLRERLRPRVSEG